MFGNGACGCGWPREATARRRAWRSPATASCWTWTASSNTSRTSCWETGDEHGNDDDPHHHHARRRVLLEAHTLRLDLRGDRGRGRALCLLAVRPAHGRVREGHPAGVHA